MMTVLYDEQGFAQAHGGVSRYFVELMKRCPAGWDWCLPILKTQNVYLQGEPFNIAAKEHCEKSRLAHLFNMVLAMALPKMVETEDAVNHRNYLKTLENGRFDILHVTSPHPRMNTWKKAVGRHPIVATIHDLTPERFWKYDLLIPRMRRRLIADASHLITVSEHTKRDLQELYDVPDEKISVVYNGQSLEISDLGKQIEWLPEKYILHVGKREGYKNFDFFVKSIASVLKADRQLFLVCTGSEFTKREERLLDSLGVRGQTIHRFVRDDEMPALFARAQVFVSASLYEGFGLPTVDAFCAGCPVLLSRSSCYPEIGGDAACYFNNGDKDDFQRQIRRILNDEVFRDELRRKGAVRAGLYTWEKCARETFAVYRRVLDSFKGA